MGSILWFSIGLGWFCPPGTYDNFFPFFFFFEREHTHARAGEGQRILGRLHTQCRALWGLMSWREIMTWAEIKSQVALTDWATQVPQQFLKSFAVITWCVRVCARARALLWAPSGHFVMLLNIPPCTGQSPTTNNYLDQNVDIKKWKNLMVIYLGVEMWGLES